MSRAGDLLREGPLRARDLVICGLLACGLLMTGPVRAQDSDLAALRRAAQDGTVSAQLALAARYRDGDGVAQNFATAAEWYARAAAAGNAEAQNRLGQLYHAGLGVRQNTPEALRWLRAAATQGAPAHLVDLASVLEDEARKQSGHQTGAPDPASTAAAREAAALYEKAAEAGHIEARVRLGLLYQNGFGVVRDIARAHALYLGPAEAGHARAQNNLGLLYVRGHGVAQDYERAFALFEAAAEQGLEQAIRNLGVMYENGFGVAHDEARAAELYRLSGGGDAAPNPPVNAPVNASGTGQNTAQNPGAPAGPGFVYDPRLAPLPGLPEDPVAERAALGRAAQAGDVLARFQLGWRLVTTPAPSPDDWTTAAALFRAAADAGLPAAMVNLSHLYALGRGVPQDYVRALAWRAVAQNAGHDDPTQQAAWLQSRMTPEQINKAQALGQALARSLTRSLAGSLAQTAASP